MSFSGTSGAPRYATLRDYLRVVRRHRILIVLVAIACAGAAFGLTVREKSSWQAQAQVFFQDPTQNVDLLGLTGVFPSLPDQTRAQVNAEALTSTPVLEEVKSVLHSPLPPGAFASAVSTFVNSQTNVVVIQAHASDPYTAQRLANGFAQAAKIYGRNQARAGFAKLEAGARAQLAQLGALSRDPYTKDVYANRVATLGFIAQTADPVQIIELAELPTAALKPPTVRNTLLGLALGLTLGLIAAFVRDALDRRLRGTAQIADQLGWPVLGHIRESAFASPVFVNPNGKPKTSDGDRESFRILRQNVRFLDVDNPPKSVVVTSALPQEGKSTVAATLACAYAAAGARTLLVECDLRRPSLANRFGLAVAPGITDFLIAEAEPKDVVQVIELPIPAGPDKWSGNGKQPSDDSERLWGSVGGTRWLACITAGRPAPETAELLGSERFKSFLEQVSMAYDQVILDSSPMLSVADTTAIIPEAAATLICVRAAQTTHNQAEALKQALDRLPHRLIGVVITGLRRGGEDDVDYYSYADAPVVS